ncbi:MAG: hypothetical protein AAGJ87_15370 [Pseudomonadota bacterium]
MTGDGGTMEKGVFNPNKGADGEMFIGWAKAPAVDRRFLFGAIPAAVATAGGAAYAVASNLADPGAGAWLTGAAHSVSGVLVNQPYPMIRMPDPTSPFGMRTVLVVSEGKCTSGLKLDEDAGRSVRADGVLIQRKDRQMLEVPLFLDKWLFDADASAFDVPALSAPRAERLGQASLSGMIMDSKCFFGVMKPSRGKTHKACATLCVRGGIPPSFWARTKDGRESVLLMTDAEGGPLKDDILPLIADAVRVTGEIVRVGDLLQLRADASAFERI